MGHINDDDDAEPFWTKQRLRARRNFGYTPPRLFKAGEGFRFECNYDNTESTGCDAARRRADEMCILFGLAWDAGDQREIPSQSCNLTWADERGVAQDTNAKGGYPAPSTDVANACCQGALASGSAGTECLKCQCNSCGDVLIKCFGDEDCGAILNCFRGCADSRLRAAVSGRDHDHSLPSACCNRSGRVEPLRTPAAPDDAHHQLLRTSL